MDIRALEDIAWAPYESIAHPTQADWKKSYDALIALAEACPEDGRYPNTLGYLCYYGRHTGKRDYPEARKWFEKGAALHMIESTYKLADMLLDGLGGPADIDRAADMYLRMYVYCKEQFESGIKDSKFADTALRIGRLFHEGKYAQKNDMEALSFLLEAKYALEWRRQFGEYGDDTVDRNIRRLIDQCEKPDEELQQSHFFGIGLGRVPRYLLGHSGELMTLEISPGEEGMLRLEFRRKCRDGKKPSRILWSVPPAMRCFMTDFVVLYTDNVPYVWTKTPGEPVVCDRYEYDEETGFHLFYLDEEVVGKLKGGDYVLALDEFWLADMTDESKSGGGQ